MVVYLYNLPENCLGGTVENQINQLAISRNGKNVFWMSGLEEVLMLIGTITSFLLKYNYAWQMVKNNNQARLKMPTINSEFSNYAIKQLLIITLLNL